MRWGWVRVGEESGHWYRVELEVRGSLFINVKVIVNVDGVEWKREKWSKLAKWILRKSEKFAVQHANVVVADNIAIQKYLNDEYAKKSVLIPYGGDHVITTSALNSAGVDLPAKFALALCRIEPENNIALILDAFGSADINLVFVGNWQNSQYGRQLFNKYSNYKNISLINPIYCKNTLHFIRSHASLYVHGHSAGGTNPALVEMMYYGIPLICFDCEYNRQTTFGNAHYFNSDVDLQALLDQATERLCDNRVKKMRLAAKKFYTWDIVARDYFKLITTDEW